MQTVPLKENERLYYFTGVDKFHKAGYYGERVSAATGEVWNTEKYNPDGLGSNIYGDSSESDHARTTAAIFWQVAPKAKLYSFRSSGRFCGSKPNPDGTWYKSDLVDKMFPKIDELGITTMFTSLSSSGNKQYREDYSKLMREHPNFCACWCAGNDGEGKYNKMMEIDEVFGIGGFLIANRDQKPAYLWQSGSSTKEALVDFCAPWTAYCHYNDPTNSIAGSGTSIATPWFCGMTALVNDFFIDKTGKPLTRDKMRQFMIDHSVDLEDEGMDKASGWGYVCLPDPSEIDIWKYAEKEVKPEPEPDKPEQPEKPIEPEKPVEPEPEQDYVLYTVVAGDSLYSIAKKFYGVGSKWPIIQQFNGLTSANIKKGQVLKIPKEDIDIPEQPETDILDEYIDSDTIADNARDAMRFCLEKGLINGMGNMLLPKSKITREDLAIVVKELYEKTI